MNRAYGPKIEHVYGMGDLERFGSGGTRWDPVYPRAPVHQVAAASVPANDTSFSPTEGPGVPSNHRTFGKQNFYRNKVVTKNIKSR